VYKHDLPHLFRLLFLFLVVVLAIVDVVGTWWYPPADLLGRTYSSVFYLQHSDLAGILMLCGWFGIGGLAMTVKKKQDWRWLISKFVSWREERERHISVPKATHASPAPKPAGVQFDYGGFDFDKYDAACASSEAALTGKSTEEIAKAGQQDPSTEEVTQTAGFREGKMGNRLRTVGRFTLGLLLLGGVATGIAAWFYHAHEVELREAEAVTSKEEHAKFIVAGVMTSWDARDDWEDSLSSSNSLYTMEVEKALISDRRLLVYGTIDDVKKSGEAENSIISIQTQTRARGLDLRLSLLSAPAVTNAIVAHKGRDYETFVFAVKIDSVEKVSTPSDRSADDYFLAHGVLYEAEPIGLYEPPAQSKSSNPSK
jgi:hypothetical protein